MDVLGLLSQANVGKIVLRLEWDCRVSATLAAPPTLVTRRAASVQTPCFAARLQTTSLPSRVQTSVLSHRTGLFLYLFTYTRTNCVQQALHRQCISIIHILNAYGMYYMRTACTTCVLHVLHAYGMYWMRTACTGCVRHVLYAYCMY